MSAEKRTGKMMTFDGIPVSVPNDITSKGKDFYISYNNNDKYIFGGVTTALVYEYPKGEIEKFYILLGNHTSQYEKIISNDGGIEECLEYFKSNRSLMSEYSDRIN